MSIYHMHADKVGLIATVVREWPVTWLIGEDGKPFDSLEAAVKALVDCPAPNIPYGCPSPKEDGTCPGHEKGADQGYADPRDAAGPHARTRSAGADPETGP